MACVHPGLKTLGESISTLRSAGRDSWVSWPLFLVSAADFCGYQRASFLFDRFVSRAKLIKNHATINEDVEGDKQALQAEIKHLKRTLAALQVVAWTRSKDLG